MGGDIKIDMAYVISDFLYAVVQRFPGKKGRWMGRVESSSRQDSLTRRGEAAPTVSDFRT
jgi:hypothetical protein